MSEMKLVIFDCDGVMFDSLEANRHFYNHMREKFGHPVMDDSELAYVHMHHVMDSVAHIFRHWPEELEMAHQYRLSVDYRDFIRHMTIEPDLVEFLEYITPFCKTAISTNRTTTMATLLDLFSLRKYYGLVVTAMDVKNAKPHPEAIHKILDHFRLKVDEGIFIGDSPVDLEHAANAGMRMIAFRNKNLAADYHVNSFMEITGLPVFSNFQAGQG
ncbi:MAG: HAD family hydrolase [Proteobacteria bacterium]|nr:HAD family hydrolase [Pseudomonadota bacterium]MBU1739308.1 HAD family hydrolase [Pseudomonadota bacterium]